MKKLLVLLALMAFSVSGARAQLGSFGDFPIEINAEETRLEAGLAVADRNVVIHYGSILIYCDYAQYNPDTRDVLVQGNVRLYRDGNLFTGERALYNLESKHLTGADFRGEFTPLEFAGDTFSSMGGNAYMVKDGIFTTSDSSKPDYHIKARTIRIYQKDRVVFSNATLYIGRTPVFWFPYLSQSLDKDQGFSITPGYKSEWGAFLLGSYSFPIAEGWSGKLRVDLLADRGVAVGLESDWANGKADRDWGRFRAYGIDDQKPGTNKTGLDREPIDGGRFRVSLQAKQYLTDDIYATVDINKLSDARFLQDFVESEFHKNPNPDNALALTYWDENFTVNLLGRENLNEDNFDATERLPEIAADIKRQPFFGSRLFYQGETSAGFLRRNYADQGPFEDYDSYRADSFHQFILPLKIKDGISFVPRIGFRGTVYSDTGHSPGTSLTEDQIEQVARDVADEQEQLEAELDALSGRHRSRAEIRNSIKNEVRKDFHRPQGVFDPGGSVFRPVFNAGFELSAKWSKAFEQVQSRAWGLDGLRHIVQPFLNAGYTYSGEDPFSLLQFDRLNPSTQRPPIDYPEFNSIDSIDTNTTVRLGLRNRWQTRRDNQTVNWLEWNTFFDTYIDRPEFSGSTFDRFRRELHRLHVDNPDLADPMNGDGGTFSNVYNQVRFNPLPWMQLSVDSQLPIFDRGFTEVNTNLNMMVTPDIRVNIGHRYINGNTFFDDSNRLDFGGYFRVGDNWAFSFRESYEIEDSTLENQRYELHRDLSSWVASLGFTVRDNRGVDSYGVLLTFTLKDLPSIHLPLSVDPDFAGDGSGSGKNR
jgi:LPS-assembly protein